MPVIVGGLVGVGSIYTGTEAEEDEGVVTVDGMRAEVHGNVFEPAAMLKSRTSQTGASTPSSRQGQALTRKNAVTKKTTL